MTWVLVSILLYAVMTSGRTLALERLCGRRLTDALALVCEGRGFYGLQHKRSGK